MKHPFLSIIASLTLVGAGCGSSNTASTETAPSTPSNQPSATGSSAAETFCAQKKDNVMRYGLRWDDKQVTLPLPQGFPAVPAGAVLCGTSPDQHIAYYYYPGHEIAPTIDAFRPSLEALNLHPTNAGASDILRFSNNKLQSESGYEGGAINFYREGGDLQIMYQKKP